MQNNVYTSFDIINIVRVCFVKIISELLLHLLSFQRDQLINSEYYMPSE